tara:strand:- start:472 stop:876 length:405 start_codon:yes stop_codon:yes gene_type:complete
VLNNELTIKLQIEIMIEACKPTQNPETLNPSTNHPMDISINPFITRIDRPKENIVRGRVSTIKVGLIKIFTKPTKAPDKNNDLREKNSMPTSRSPAIQSERVFTKHTIPILQVFFKTVLKSIPDILFSYSPEYP